MVDFTDKTVRHYSLLHKLGLFETMDIIYTTFPHFDTNGYLKVADYND